MAGEANNQAAAASPFEGALKAVLSGDLYLAVGVIIILGILLAPMPTMLLDLALASSISFSVLILMTALFIQRPLEFSAFPTVLLIATMSRLALNLASTRLILTEGQKGTGAAGHVIEAFGKFVMRGDVLVGIIVFTILVIVNFIVITKGSGRIAEVAARFTLDAMPGKQMAIDADLSSGLINEDQARVRRRELEEESNFFGAMDGASKFVRGDAIAGVLITVINVVAGIVIGAVNKGMGFQHALETYTILTVGDGLVTQVPALIVSTAAGLFVSKAGIEGAADKALLKQFSRYPQGLGLVSAVIFLMGFLPGLPTVWFMAISLGAGFLAWRAAQREAESGSARRCRGTEESGSADRRADHLCPGARSSAPRAWLRPAATDQRCCGPSADRSDQGIAPSACRRDGLCDAGRAHSRQYAAADQRLFDPCQRAERRARRAPAQSLSSPWTRAAAMSS